VWRGPSACDLDGSEENSCGDKEKIELDFGEVCKVKKQWHEWSVTSKSIASGFC
jgi:hypothetical protein